MAYDYEAAAKNMMSKWGGNPADAGYWGKQLQAGADIGTLAQNMSGRTLGTDAAGDISGLMSGFGGNPDDSDYWTGQYESLGTNDFMGGDSFSNMTGQTYSDTVTGSTAANASGVSSNVQDAQKTGMAGLQEALKAGRFDVQGGQANALGNINMRFNESTGRYEPYLNAGGSALDRLNQKLIDGPGELKESEGYRYRQDEAMDTLERRASAGGYMGDPRMAEEMMRTSQGIASDERQRFLNEYYASLAPNMQMTGMGLKSTGEMGQLGQTAGLASADIETRASQLLAGMGMNVAETGLTTGMAASDTDVKNTLAKYGIDTAADIDYSRLGLIELQQLRDMAWRSGETELGRKFDMAMAEKGYDFYDRQNTKNQQNIMWNTIISGAGYIGGKWLNDSNTSSWDDFWGGGE